jgi:small subunit ribosomal protein S15
MAISKEQKMEYTEKFGANAKDTGNSKVQVAIFTQRIQDLTEHLKTHTKDNHTRLGLLKLVGKRRRLLRYLEGSDISVYRSLIKELGIRK